MEQKGIDASLEFIGSEDTLVTVANVLNHCSCLSYERVEWNMWHRGKM